MTDAVKKNNANTLPIKYCKNDRPLIIHDPGLGGQKSSAWMRIHVVVCVWTKLAAQTCVDVKELFHTGKNSTIISNHYVNTPGLHSSSTVYIVESHQTMINKRYS